MPLTCLQRTRSQSPCSPTLWIGWAVPDSALQRSRVVQVNESVGADRNTLYFTCMRPVKSRCLRSCARPVGWLGTSNSLQKPKRLIPLSPDKIARPIDSAHSDQDVCEQSSGLASFLKTRRLPRCIHEAARRNQSRRHWPREASPQTKTLSSQSGQSIPCQSLVSERQQRSTHNSRQLEGIV
jgi:hypothetical protein